jgi:RecB family exonuclease
MRYDKELQVSLPIDFVASATALECYEICPRRFRHRYIDHLPTAGPDPANESQMRRGNLFHRLILWDDLGLDTSLILDAEIDPDLQAQWTAFRGFRESLTADGVSLQHDQTLSARCAGYQVQARLDAIAIRPGGAVTIYDWKTSRHPNHARLADSPQSKVYPFVVWHVMRNRPGVSLTDPAPISLVYWFPETPDMPLQIDCTPERLSIAAEWLEYALQTIAADAGFEMTHDRATCKTCEYLAHCGVRAEDGATWELDEDYYQLPEVDEDSPFDAVSWLGQG